MIAALDSIPGWFFALGCALVLGACSESPDDSADDATSTATESESGSESESESESETGDEPEYEPVLEERSCPFDIPAERSADCYTLFVPLDREDLNAGAVALPVAVIHPVGAASRPPVVYFHGGPGGSTFEYSSAWFDRAIADDGETVVFDQRGSGLSVPSLDCTEAEAAWFAVFGGAGTPTEEIAILDQAYVDCRARLAAETDLDAFDSQANADDVEDLRRALGYDSWSLYGISYGTRLALTVMRRHPEAIERVVIDSVYPPQVGGNDWMLTSLQGALDRLVAGCLDEATCAATFPDLAADLDTVVANLDATPYMLSIDDSDGVPHDLSLTGADFYAGMFNALYDVDLIPLVPFLIYSAAQGDYSFLIDLANQSIPFLTAIFEGARLSIDCADGGVLIDQAQLPGLIADHPELSTMFGAYALPFCATWNVEQVPEEFLEPVVSDIPTLVLAGEYDPVTPVSQSELANEGLSAGELYVFPGLGHGVSRDSDCGAQMTREFLRDGAADSSCWSALPQDTF